MCVYKSGLIPLGWVTRESIDLKTPNLTIKYVLFWITPFENTHLDASVLQSLELELFFLHPLKREMLTKKGYSSFLLSRKSNRNWNQTVGNQSNQKLWFYAHIIKKYKPKKPLHSKVTCTLWIPILFSPFFSSHHIFADLFSFFFFPPNLHFYSIMLLPIHFPLLTVCPPIFDWVRVSHITYLCAGKRSSS